MYLSVIMPVYNAQKTVAEAIESVLAQSFGDFEFLIVNDGSTDATAEIIKKYADQDDRIRVFEQENRGVAGARNAALEETRGRYITFVDADDIVPPDAYNYMHQIAVTQGGSMIVGRADRLDGVSRYESVRLRRMTESVMIYRNDLNMLFGMTVWHRWFLRSEVMKNNVRFSELKHMEDAVFVYQFLKTAKIISTCPHIVYTYRKPLASESTSVTRNASAELFESLMSSYRMLQDLTRGYGKEFEETLRFRYMQSFLGGVYYRQFWKLGRDGQKRVLERMEDFYPRLTPEYQEIFRDHNQDIFRDGKMITAREFVKAPLITIAVRKMSEDHIFPFLQCLYDQNLPSFVVWMDHRLKPHVPKAYQEMPNLFFRKRDVFKLALSKAKSPYVTFVEDDIIYELKSLQEAVLRMDRDETIDGISEKLVYMKDGKCSTIDLMEEAYEQGRPRIDLTLSNKIFRKDALEKGGFSWKMPQEEQNAFLCLSLHIEKSANPCMITMKPDELRMIDTNPPEAGEEPAGEIVETESPEPAETVEEVAAASHRARYRDEFYPNENIRNDIVLMIGRKDGPSVLLTEIARALASEKYGKKRIYYPVNKDDYERVSEYFEREIPGQIRVIKKGGTYVKALSNARNIITEAGMPYWWIKKPLQKLFTIWTDEEDADDGNHPYLLHRNLLLSDHLYFTSDKSRERILGSFSFAPYLRGKMIETAEGSLEETAEVMCSEITGLENVSKSLATSSKLPLFIVSQDLSPEGTRMIRQLKEKDLLPENSCLLSFYYMSQENDAADRKVGEILPLFWLRGLPCNSYVGRRYWLGGRKVDKIILMDCDHPLIIRSFARFAEESTLLVNDRLYDAAISQDERTLFALRVFKRAGNGIFMKDPAKAEALSELIGTEVGIIRNPEEWADSLF